MCTSLSLSYLGYQASDVRLFDGTEPIEAPLEAETGLTEIPAPDEAAGEAPAGLVEIEDQAEESAP